MMLEQIGVDYLLLEAYSEITAKSGAGIALLPNGLRILDQLRCYEDIVGHVRHAIDSIDVRNSRGELLSSVDGWKKRCTDRLVVQEYWENELVMLIITL
jgi:2-polyprenyl-6-methoxyphenol hydroxylase-like FAD-dependent oxidoreductase